MSRLVVAHRAQSTGNSSYPEPRRNPITGSDDGCASAPAALLRPPISIQAEPHLLPLRPMLPGMNSSLGMMVRSTARCCSSHPPFHATLALFDTFSQPNSLINSPTVHASSY